MCITAATARADWARAQEVVAAFDRKIARKQLPPQPPQNARQRDKTMRVAYVCFAACVVVVLNQVDTSAAAAAPAKKNKDKAFEADCLAAHNKWRRLHDAPPLEFDRKIAAFSAKRAEHIAQSDGSEFKHPNDLPYGENLAWHSRAKKSCAELVRMWYDEVELYDFNKPSFSLDTGHFTQLVWRSTRRVGCARAISEGPRGGVYLVCNYDPPGNFLGENDENVRRRTAVVAVTTAPTTSTTALSTTTSTSTTTTTTTRKPTPQKPKKPKKKKNKKRKNKNKKRTQVSTTTSTTTTTTTTTTTAKPTPKKRVNKNKKRNQKKKKKQRQQQTTTTTDSTLR